MILDTCRLGLMILLSQVNGINGDDDIYVFKLHKSLMFLVSCKRQSLSINQETFHSSDNSSSQKINVVTLLRPIWAFPGTRELGGVRVSFLFGNDLLWNDLPYSKGCMMFGNLELSKIMFYFWFFFVGREAFDPVCEGQNLVFLINLIFFGEMGLNAYCPFPKS